MAKRGSFEDITGKRFGKLVVKQFSHRDDRSDIHWLCVCDCGKLTVTNKSALKNGKTKSCGCFNNEMCAVIGRLNKTHGFTSGVKKHRMYKIWANMKERCSIKTRPSFVYYGGRGIKYFNEWGKFENFLRDMGDSYTIHVEKFGEKNTQLDRIDVNGDYCTKNCRWATILEQSYNKRNSRMIDAFGERKCLAEWALDPRCKVGRGTFQARYYRGKLSIEDCFSVIVHK